MLKESRFRNRFGSVRVLTLLSLWAVMSVSLLRSNAGPFSTFVDFSLAANMSPTKSYSTEKIIGNLRKNSNRGSKEIVKTSLCGRGANF